MSTYTVYQKASVFMPTNKKRFCFITGLPLSGRPVINSVFGRLCRKTVPRGREDTRSGTERRCSHKWFHTIFPCTDPSTNTFCTCPPPRPRNPEGVANLKGGICVAQSDSIMGVILTSFVIVRV